VLEETVIEGIIVEGIDQIADGLNAFPKALCVCVSEVVVLSVKNTDPGLLRFVRLAKSLIPSVVNVLIMDGVGLVLDNGSESFSACRRSHRFAIHHLPLSSTVKWVSSVAGKWSKRVMKLTDCALS
jgi:hypothetical protein